MFIFLIILIYRKTENMKNKIMKATLVALSMTYLAPISQVRAMEDDKDKTEVNRNIKENQNQEYALSLFTEKVLKNEEFKELLEKYQKIGIFEDNNNLQVQMKKHYMEYLEACKKENILPFIPGGLLSFLVPNVQQISGTFLLKPKDVREQCIDLWKENDDNFLFPQCNPSNVLDVINIILLPKYNGSVHKMFKQNTLDLSHLDEEGKNKVMRVLSTNTDNMEILSSASPLLIALRMMMPCPDIRISSVNLNHWEMQPIQAVTSGGIGVKRPMLFCMGGIKNREFFINAKGFIEAVTHSLQHMWFNNNQNDSQSIREKLINEVIEQLDQFYLGGQHVYSFKEPQKLGREMTAWLNLFYNLASFERELWKEKAPQMKKFINQYQWVCSALEMEDDRLYSSLNLSDHFIGLSLTSKKEKAEEREILKKEAQEEFKLYEDEVKAYETIKPYLSTLKKITVWFEKLTGALQKKGRIS